MSLRGIPKNTDTASIVVELVKLLKPHTYVELGTKRGFTFNQIAPLVPRAVGVDTGGFNGVVARPNTELYEMTTDDFVETWNSPIDFLFIDACHKKEQVLKDFNNFFPFVKPNTGIVCLHDTYPVCSELAVDGYCGDAWVAAHEIRISSQYSLYCEIVTIPGPWFGLSIIRKVNWERHLEWKK